MLGIFSYTQIFEASLLWLKKKLFSLKAWVYTHKVFG